MPAYSLLIKTVDTLFMAAPSPRAKVVALDFNKAQRHSKLSEWFQQNRSRLLAYVQRKLPAEFCPEDIVQEIFAKLMQRKDPQDLENPGAYLMMMAKNTVIDHLRRNKHEQHYREQQPDDHSPESSDLHYPEMLIAMEQAIKDLPERCREVFILSRYHGLKTAEIAQRLDISPRMVQKHLIKAFDHFQAHLI